MQVIPSVRSVGVMCSLLSSPRQVSSTSSEEDPVTAEGEDTDYAHETTSDDSDMSDDDRDIEVEESSAVLTPLRSQCCPIDERYFLVSETALHRLASHCRHCGSQATVVVRQSVGTLVMVAATCALGHTL